MKYNTLIFVILLTLCGCNLTSKKQNISIPFTTDSLLIANKTLGVGFLELSFDDPWPLYRADKDTVPFDTLLFIHNDNGKLTYQTNVLKDELKPFIMFVGHSYEEAEEQENVGLIGLPPRLTFRVLKDAETYYTIVINEDNFKTAVIKKATDMAILPRDNYPSSGEIKLDKRKRTFVKYETWADYLKRVPFVYVEYGKTEIYDHPNGEIIFKDTMNRDIDFRVKEVENEWIKVAPRFSYVNINGWMKWRDKDSLIVSIVEYMLK